MLEQLHCFFQFLLNHKLAGAVKNVVKTKTKDQLVSDYKTLFDDKVCFAYCDMFLLFAKIINCYL